MLKDKVVSTTNGTMTKESCQLEELSAVFITDLTTL
jgi:hypothetical protein